MYLCLNSAGAYVDDGQEESDGAWEVLPTANLKVLASGIFDALDRPLPYLPDIVVLTDMRIIGAIIFEADRALCTGDSLSSRRTRGPCSIPA